MSDRSLGASTNQVRDVPRPIVISLVLVFVTLVAGTYGFFLHLRTLPAYNDARTYQILFEGFFRSSGFLVLSMGSLSTMNTTALILITLGRITGLAFFSYAAVRGVLFLLAERLQPVHIKWWNALGRLPGVSGRGHVLVWGTDDDGYAIATEALEEGRNVVVIDSEESDRSADLKSLGAIVFEGNASHQEFLRKQTRIDHANDAFVTSPDGTTNGAIVKTICQTVATTQRDDMLDCTARIEDRQLRRALHEEALTLDGFHLQTYDVPEATARELLAAHPVDDIQSSNERIHVWLVGWTNITQAVFEQLLQLMHYPDAVERQITIITSAVDPIEQEVAEMAPGINPDWWASEDIRKLVENIFPEIDVRQLPETDIELLSDRTSLYQTIRDEDRLTIIADDTDSWSVRTLVSVWAPKLDELTRRRNLDAHLLYRGTEGSNWTPSVSTLEATPYVRYGDGCSIKSVRGERRDRIARRLALIYHLLYSDTSSDRLPDGEKIPLDINPNIESVTRWVRSLSADKRRNFEHAVWQNLPEYQRESNRHAADHAAVKRRQAAMLDETGVDTSDDIIRKLSKSEHRRWCAEKILDGWEPLPDNERDRWESSAGEQQLRQQRYHPDIKSVATLRAETEGEWVKDLSQVRAILKNPDLFEHESPDENYGT